MADPEELLRDPLPESPPPEIVLAAVRVFRYRVLAVTAIVLALIVAGSVVVQRLAENGRFLVEVADAHYTGGVLANAEGVGETETTGGVTSMVSEVVRSPDGGTIYVHVIGWDDRGRNLWLTVEDPRFGGVPANETGLEGGGVRATDRTLLDLWFAVERRTPGSLTFDAVVIDAQGEVVARMPFEIGMEQGMP